MTLNLPIVITSRLLPSVHIRQNNALYEISIERIERNGETRDNRDRFRYYIDGSDIEYTNNTLRSGVGVGSLQEALGTLLSFLGAAAEAWRYGPRSDNYDMFPKNVMEFCAQHSDEIALLQCEIEESEQELIEE